MWLGLGVGLVNLGGVKNITTLELQGKKNW